MDTADLFQCLKRECQKMGGMCRGGSVNLSPCNTLPVPRSAWQLHVLAVSVYSHKGQPQCKERTSHLPIKHMCKNKNNTVCIPSYQALIVSALAHRHNQSLADTPKWNKAIIKIIRNPDASPATQVSVSIRCDQHFPCILYQQERKWNGLFSFCYTLFVDFCYGQNHFIPWA